jgi:hypothetical protein
MLHRSFSLLDGEVWREQLVADVVVGDDADERALSV